MSGNARRPLHVTPYYTYIGIRAPEDEESGTLTVERSPELLNSHGAVHGGVIMGLLDAALSRAIRLRAEGEIKIATVDLTVHFLAPAIGERVSATATVLRMGSRLAYAQGTAMSESEPAIAAATGVFRIFS